MNLKERINEDFKSAFKGKEEVRLSVLKMLRAAIGNAEIEKRAKTSECGCGGELSDDEILAVVAREVKKRKDSAEAYASGGRPELAEQEQREIAALTGYLPAQMPEAELRELVKKAIEQSGAKSMADIGSIMKIIMPQIKGKADGNAVNKVAKELLG